MASESGTGAVAPESLSKQLCGAPMGDGRRHDTDESGDYLPNGRQIQGAEKGKEGWRGGAEGRTDEGLSITFEKGTKADTALVIGCYLSSRVWNSGTNVLCPSHEQ